MSLFSGKIDLENVKIKPSAFEGTGLPLNIVHGSIGKNELTYNVLALYNNITLHVIHALLAQTQLNIHVHLLLCFICQGRSRSLRIGYP